jgi:hypothetical protein
MKTVGWIIVAVGVCYLIVAFNMNVSVSVPSTYIPSVGSVGGGEVANLDLMARRQNHIIAAALMIVVGALLGIFGPMTLTNSSDGLEKAADLPTSFDGTKDLSNDAYRLWLAKRYGVERNEVFDRFVMQGRTFDTLNAALAVAHEQELETDRIALESEQQRAAIAAQRKAEQEAYEAEELAKWERNKYKVFTITGMAIVGGVAIFWSLLPTEEERAAAKAADAAKEVAFKSSINEKYNITLPDDATSIKDAPVNSSNDTWCDNALEGDVLRFETKESANSIVTMIDQTFGKGSADSDGYDDEDAYSRRTWTKKSGTLMLTYLSGTVYLCKTPVI